MRGVYRQEQRGQSERGTDGPRRKQSRDESTLQRRKDVSRVSTLQRRKDARVCRELWGGASISSHCPEATYPKGRKGRSEQIQASNALLLSDRVRQLVQSQALWLPPPRNEKHKELVLTGGGLSSKAELCTAPRKPSKDPRKVCPQMGEGLSIIPMCTCWQQVCLWACS